VVTTRKPAVTEREFQAQVLRLARLCNYLTYHTFDSRRSAHGYPDLTLARSDRPVLLLELKVGRRPLTPAQARWLSVLRAAGLHAYCVRPESWNALEAVLVRGADPGCLGGGVA
jgi:hypothetical protein